MMNTVSLFHLRYTFAVGCSDVQCGAIVVWSNDARLCCIVMSNKRGDDTRPASILRFVCHSECRAVLMNRHLLDLYYLHARNLDTYTVLRYVCIYVYMHDM